MKPRVFIDPATDILYASYYIKGLYEIFGKDRVRFRSYYFNKFKHDNHTLAFIVINEEGEENRVVIDFTDSALLDLQALEWCHVYGKINYDGKLQSEKIMSIAPSFGIRIYSGVSTFIHAAVNLLKAFSRIPNKRRFLSDYKSQFKRPKLEEYQSKSKKNNYVFFMASLWKSEKETNTFRANFIKACKANNEVEFEGGFAPRSKDDIRGFEALTAASRITMSNYLEKVSNSLVVFNTPAVKECHGWKLGEYLCMGKAIISTPLKRKLPVDLEDAKHAVFTDGSMADLEKKIMEIIKNKELRTRLETNALEYYSNYCKPEVVIQQLLSNV